MDRDYESLGGWLLFYTIITVIGLLDSFKTFFQYLQPYGGADFQLLYNMSNAASRAFLFYTIATSAIGICLTLSVLIVILRRTYNGHKIIVKIFIASVILTAINIIVMMMVPMNEYVPKGAIGVSVFLIILSIIIVCLWIRYFTISERVQVYFNGATEWESENKWGRSYTKQEEDSPKKKIVKPQEIYVRNFYINSPLRPCNANIYINDNGKIAHSIFVKNCDKTECDSIRVNVRDYDAFENILCDTNLTVTNPEKSVDGFSFISVIDSDNVAFESVNYLEIYIEAYANGANYIKLENPQKCTDLIPVNEMAAFKQGFGEYAVRPYSEHEDYWFCVCGNKCKKGSACSFCGRTFGQKDNYMVEFLRTLSQISDPTEIKNSFIKLENTLSLEKYNAVLSHLNKMEMFKRTYGIKEVSEEEKDKIRKLL